MYPPCRQDRLLPNAAAFALLDAAEYGVLSITGADASPYGVPLNYVRDGETLILHGAGEGRKIDCLRHDDRVSFCVVGRSEPLREKFTTRYESVIVSGRAELVEDADRKAALLLKLCERFAPDGKPDHRAAAQAMIEKYGKGTALILVRIETITGKANRA